MRIYYPFGNVKSDIDILTSSSTFLWTMKYVNILTLIQVDDNIYTRYEVSLFAYGYCMGAKT